MNVPEEQESRDFAGRTTKSRKSARREGKFLSILSPGVLACTPSFIYRDVSTWGGITHGFLDRTEVREAINAVCLPIEPRQHHISLRTHPKKRKIWCVSIDKRDGRSLPEHFVRCCIKELDIPHLCCFHDALRPRLPGTSPTGRAPVARKPSIDINLSTE